ncbi:DUF4112 domain-containing protein [Microvirga pudoricolor]|uniref:DUF4112 domain-containing protein n=1 Tax=Microvirga pudoricolor TaxID=2778729 RepID=UPI001951AA67|nr:DUF4112 domain-containing protein [Microvirga pudoricolor]MBM6592815.1 DUF4112 domain-containing protein [Microvirga pudoricolor]
MNASRAAFFETVKASGPTATDSLARITLLAKLMDNAFVIPGLNRRVGFDALIGAVPVVGDAITAAVSSYIIWEARQLGLPRWKIARMLGNVAVDTAIGAIPLAGDVFDVFFRANMRNLRIIQDHLDRDSMGRRRPPTTIDGTAVRVGER